MTEPFSVAAEVANGEVTLRDLRGDTGQQRIDLVDLAEHVTRLLS